MEMKTRRQGMSKFSALSSHKKLDLAEREESLAGNDNQIMTDLKIGGANNLLLFLIAKAKELLSNNAEKLLGENALCFFLFCRVAPPSTEQFR